MEFSKKEDRYLKVRDEIKNYECDEIPVPYVAKLLEIDSPTLNNRIQEKKIPHSTRRIEGSRTNFISKDTALDFVERHKYALMGWITLREAGALINVNPNTLKGRCVTGRLEGYVDLTKRLRVNPKDVVNIRLRKGTNMNYFVPLDEDINRHKPVPLAKQRTPPVSKIKALKNCKNQLEVKVIRAEDYGISEISPVKNDSLCNSKEKKGIQEIIYNPDNPPSYTECKIGMCLIYGRQAGKIRRVVLEDPYRPMVEVDFNRNFNGILGKGTLLLLKR